MGSTPAKRASPSGLGHLIIDSVFWFRHSDFPLGSPFWFLVSDLPNIPHLIHPIMHRDFPYPTWACALRWITEKIFIAKELDSPRAALYFPSSSGMKVTGEIGKRS
jgi:hypothetical protein